MVSHLNLRYNSLMAINATCSILSTFMKRLEDIPLEEGSVDAWLKLYGAHYVDEKIRLMEKRNKDTWEARDFLQRAILQNWKSKDMFPTHEENVKWYRSLHDGEKIEQYKKALCKQDIFELHLKIKKISYLDEDFHESTYFKYMMSLLGRFP